MIALVLAKALRERQLDGALLGFQRGEPTAEGIALYPHPVMASRVIRELLPRADDDYGELWGVPGLRARWDRGTIVLYDLMTTAQVHVIWPRHFPPVIGDLDSPGRALWRRDRLGTEETADRAHWTGEAYGIRTQPWAVEAAARDWLLSRLLRRVALVNQGASPHGFANTYSHGDIDLVVESCCCRTDPAEINRRLNLSKLAVRPEDPMLEALEPPPQPLLSGEISLGGNIGVTFRRRREHGCDLKPGRADAQVYKQLREWYS